MRALVVLLALSISIGAAAQELPPLAGTSPVWSGLSRPEGLELARADQQWRLATGLAYANSFLLDGAVLSAHEEFGGPARPVGPDAWNAARERSPGRPLYALDGETLRLDLEAQRGFGAWYVGWRVSAFRFGGTGVDGLPRWWHDLIGVGSGGRDRVADGGAMVAASFGGLSAASAGAVTRAGPFSLWSGRQWGGADRGVRAWATASAGPEWPGLRADAWSLGARVAGWRRWDRLRLHGGIGWTEHDADLAGGEEVGATGHLWAGGQIALGERWSAEAVVRVDQSPWREAIAGGPGETSGEFAIGLSRELAAGWRLQASFCEDLPGMGAAPDFGIQIRLLYARSEVP